jgi:hypothetical protein
MTHNPSHQGEGRRVGARRRAERREQRRELGRDGLLGKTHDLGDLRVRLPFDDERHQSRALFVERAGAVVVRDGRGRGPGERRQLGAPRPAEPPDANLVVHETLRDRVEHQTHPLEHRFLLGLLAPGQDRLRGRQDDLQRRVLGQRRVHRAQRRAR